MWSPTLGGPDDKIWGLWEADDFSFEICKNVDRQLQQYETKLDLIYDDSVAHNNTQEYNRLIFWNGSILSNK
jgi:hypothetical protein